MGTDYDDYIRAEWNMFVENPERQAETLEAVSGLSIKRVLDVGCGAGQELLPFASFADCTGIDPSPEVGVVGRELFRESGLESKVAFACAMAEALPFRSASFDLVICRLALPYTDNARAIAEMARVLSVEGRLLLKIHHAKYYWQKLRRGFLARDIFSMVHSARVLVAGSIYHLTRRQIRSALLSAETFQTERLLRYEFKRCGLEIERLMPSSNPATPFFLVRTLKSMRSVP